MAASQKVVRPMDGNLTVLNFALTKRIQSTTKTRHIEAVEACQLLLH
jgi:hypothetical protein